jgi:DNA-binding NtrC family response regulator
MTTAKNQPILIVDQDAHFREELYNFLLSAGYKKVDSAKTLTEVLEKLEESEYYVVVLDAGSHLKAACRSADSITDLSPNTRVILLVGDEDRPTPRPIAGETHEFLIKATFTRNLLYLLENGA